MHGRISLLVAGLALALGGGVAGAALVAGPAEHTPTEAVSLTAERSAADAEKLARASARHALRAAQRARRIARRARNKANEGLATAVALLDDVDKALADSANALQTANNVNSRLNSTEIVSATEPGKVTTGSTTRYVALGGPQVSATVPSSGFIEVFVSATIGDEADPSVAADGAVALFEDGVRVPINQDGNCTGSPGLDDALISAQSPAPGDEFTLSTPPVFGFVGCGALGDAPTPVLMERPPGRHTYELRYGDCDCAAEDAAFQDRTLSIEPQL